MRAKLNGIKDIWQVAREALVLSQLATYLMFMKYQAD